jgi:hypothetical protein
MRHRDGFEARHLTRRDFLRGAAGGALTAAFAGAGSASAQAAKRPKVVVVRDEHALGADGRPVQAVVDEMLGAAMKELTGAAGDAGWRRVFKATDFVGIKGTLMMTPTRFEVLQAIVQGLQSAGVKPDRIVAWDRAMGATSLEQMRALFEGGGAPGPQTFRIPFGEDNISTVITQKATALINLPGLKSHWLSGVAGAIKNWCGAVTRINVPDRDTPYPIHTNHCERLAMLNAMPPIRDKQRLIIVDGLRALFEGGPQVDPRYLWDYNGFIVGTDPVAVDAVCLAIIQAKRDAYRGRSWPVQPPPIHIAVAEKEFGLGVSELSRIDVRKIGWQRDVRVGPVR